MLSISRLLPFLRAGFQVLFILAMIFFFNGFFEMPRSERESVLSIVNAHEHIETEEAAAVYQAASKRFGIGHTIILGSPEAAFIPGKSGFARADDNNELMLRLAMRDPEHYTFFATVNPEDPEKLSKLKKYLARGAKGLKLYSGHSMYHRQPLDESSMDEVYAFCEKMNVPIIFHVNPALYQQEFENVLQRYPRMKVVCPHFCLSTIRVDRFQMLMDRYPNLYTDTSFGFEDFFKEALLRFSANPSLYRQLILQYQDRILFGLDLIVSSEPYKDKKWLGRMMEAYRNVLEKETFVFRDMPSVTLRGFNLDNIVLRKIYSANFKRLMHLKLQPQPKE